jgi:hypothetical protein
MADYRLSKNGVIRNADSANIPNSPGNADWEKYQDWVALGNTPDPEVIVTLTLDEEIAQQSDWLRAIIEESFPNTTALKARVTAIRAAKGGS